MEIPGASSLAGTVKFGGGYGDVTNGGVTITDAGVLSVDGNTLLKGTASVTGAIPPVVGYTMESRSGSLMAITTCPTPIVTLAWPVPTVHGLGPWPDSPLLKDCN